MLSATAGKSGQQPCGRVFKPLMPCSFLSVTVGCCRLELSAAIAAEGLQPLMRPDTPAALREVLESCWQLDPSKRPTAAQLEHRLQDMKARGMSEPGTQCSRTLQLRSFWDLHQDSTPHTLPSRPQHSSNLQLPQT